MSKIICNQIWTTVTGRMRNLRVSCRQSTFCTHPLTLHSPETIAEEDTNSDDRAADPTTVEVEGMSEGNQETSSERRNKKSTLTCAQCGKKFFKLHRLEGHLRQHQGLKVCLHLIVHVHASIHRYHFQPCVCRICGKSFSKWSGLSLHMSGWHNDKPDKKQFPCDADNCDKAYNMKQSLSLHKKICHSDTAPVHEIKCVCEICGKPFKTSNALKVSRFVVWLIP